MQEPMPIEQKIMTPAEIIQSAISSGANLEQLEKLMSLQERWEANEAKKAYYEAMSLFKANPPKIEKDKKVGYSTSKGNVGYSHASLYNVVEKISSELSKYGLSASWRTQQNEKISVTCIISHKNGHSEQTTITADADQSGSKNSIQAIGSTISYLQRYSILAMTGLATHDMDIDGIVEEEKIDENKIKIIKDLIKDTKTDEKKFIEYMNVSSVEEIPVSAYAKAKMALENKKRKASK